MYAYTKIQRERKRNAPNVREYRIAINVVFFSSFDHQKRVCCVCYVIFSGLRIFLFVCSWILFLLLLLLKRIPICDGWTVNIHNQSIRFFFVFIFFFWCMYPSVFYICFFFCFSVESQIWMFFFLSLLRSLLCHTGSFHLIHFAFVYSIRSFAYTTPHESHL